MPGGKCVAGGGSGSNTNGSPKSVNICQVYRPYQPVISIPWVLGGGVKFAGIGNVHFPPVLR